MSKLKLINIIRADAYVNISKKCIHDLLNIIETTVDLSVNQLVARSIWPSALVQSQRALTEHCNNVVIVFPSNE
ncbi:hypothetical protein EB001_24085 [bacterium]|nr:hypothetical protein [bacterium]